MLWWFFCPKLLLQMILRIVVQLVCQFGFCREFICSSNLNHITDDILKASHKRRKMVLISIDLPKVFDTLNYKFFYSFFNWSWQFFCIISPLVSFRTLLTGFWQWISFENYASDVRCSASIHTPFLFCFLFMRIKFVNILIITKNIIICSCTIHANINMNSNLKNITDFCKGYGLILNIGKINATILRS